MVPPLREEDGAYENDQVPFLVPNFGDILAFWTKIQGLFTQHSPYQFCFSSKYD